jgi:CheY-like chemotaxis protein
MTENLANHGRRVLVVDDEALVAMLVADMVETLGYVVVGPALTLDKALKLAVEAPLDCAILDMNLGNGVVSTPIAQALVARGAPFLFATGYESDGMAALFEKAPVLRKPFMMTDLEQALRRITAHDGPV